MANTTYNKVTFAGKTLIDLTGDTVTADKILSGYTAHDRSGKKITGTFLNNYPASFDLLNNIQDDAGNNLLDNNSAVLNGVVTYKIA